MRGTGPCTCLSRGLADSAGDIGGDALLGTRVRLRLRLPTASQSTSTALREPHPCRGQPGCL